MGDFKDSLLLDTENTYLDVSLKPESSSTYELRSRAVTKQQGKIITQSEILSVQNSKRGNHKLQRQNTMTNDIYFEDIKEETCSQESISMLQECYKNPENGFPELWQTCIDSPLDMTIAENDEVRDVSDNTESLKADIMKSTVETGTQTECPILVNVKREEEITKHANFVACIARLKAMLSLKNKKEDLSPQDVLEIIEKNSCEKEFSMERNSERDVVLPKETRGYILRSFGSENTFRETVETLIFHMENILKEDFLEAAGCWRNSIYEKAIDILSEAIDCDPGIRETVESFLFRVLESFLKYDKRTKNLVLESKAILIMTFCKSAHLSLPSVRYLIGYLKSLEAKPMVFAKKQYRSNFVKNFCVLIRILEVSLESVKSWLSDKEINKILHTKQEIENYNVLELWKKHWRVDETPEKTKAELKWKMMISNWLDTLDEVLVNCVNYFPITAMGFERCKRLVIDISKISYAEERKTENIED